MIRALPLALLLAACSSPRPDVAVSDAWARATAAGQSAAVYATLTNSGGDDALTGASTPRAGMAMVHLGETVSGVARMRHATSLAVPADGRLALAPGGSHIMLSGLTAPLVAGETFALTLTFAKAGSRSVTVTVVAPGSR